VAASSTVSITGTVTDLPTGDKAIGPITCTSAAAVASETQLVLASGANTITVPAAATLAIIVFDATSNVNKTLKGVTGDTGILVAKAGCFMLQLDAAAVASFVITAASADTAKTTTVIFI